MKDRLSTSELLATARQRTGLDDFGPDDFREGFEVLVSGINNEVPIQEDRWDKVRERLLRLLINRLWFARDLKEHPEILDQELGTPVVISSLPRTASTKLHRILGATGDFQVTRLWQVHMFARIPGLPEGGRERRIRETRDYEQWVYQASPSMLTGHPIFTDEPEEDMLLGEFAFRHSILLGIFDSPGYMQWLMQADMQPMYNYLRMQLQYLQWQNKTEAKKPWLLKTPIHFGNEARLLELFGGARFIVTHRNPVKCIPSISSTTLGWRGMYSDNCSVENSSSTMSLMFSHAASQHIKWRESNPEAAILDLGFDEVTQDGLGTIGKVYDFLDMELSETAKKTVLAWEAENARDKHGKHNYAAEQLGLGQETIEQSFQEYIRQFSTYF